MAEIEASLDAVALARQAGDVIVALDAERTVRWASQPDVPVGGDAAALVDARDRDLLDGLLTDVPSGPVVLRLAGAGARQASAVAVPRSDGWLVQLRRPRPAVGRAAEDPWRGRGARAVATGEEALDELAWLLSATPRTGREIAVVAFDLDGFAEINVRHGSAIGDEVLAVVSDRVVDAVRSGDLVARLADDQFLVVLRGVHHLRGSIRVANKIRAAIEDPITVSTGGALSQTASVGVTLVSLGESVDAVLERVESAVAMAKAVGGNVVRSDPPI